MRRLLALLALLAVGASCEPAVDLEIPAREEGQRVLDRAGILDDDALAPLLADVAPDTDVVALTYETEQAGRGEAARAGQQLIEAWDADIVLVAVARPGDFASTADDPTQEGSRQRFFGVEPADAFAVPGALREEIVEGVVPPIAAANDWQAVFTAAALQLREGLAVSP